MTRARMTTFTRDELDAQIAGLEADYPFFPAVDRDACCSGCVADDVLRERGEEAYVAWVEYEALLWLRGDS